MPQRFSWPSGLAREQPLHLRGRKRFAGFDDVRILYSSAANASAISRRVRALPVLGDLRAKRFASFTIKPDRDKAKGMRILLVEDEPNLGDAVQEHLRQAGHAVDWFQRLDAADTAIRTVAYDALLLDLHLPDGNGLDLLRALRARRDALLVVILTACDQVSYRIEGLSAGADDYLVKPFDINDLNARLNAVAQALTISRLD